MSVVDNTGGNCLRHGCSRYHSPYMIEISIIYDGLVCVKPFTSASLAWFCGGGRRCFVLSANADRCAHTNSVIRMRNVMITNNIGPRVTVVFLVSSTLTTYEVSRDRTHLERVKRLCRTGKGSSRRCTQTADTPDEIKHMPWG